MKKSFFPTFSKILTFREKLCVLEIILKNRFFVNILQNVNGNRMFFENTPITRFLPISPKISIFKKICLSKNWFWHIIYAIKYQHFKNHYWDRKYQHFEESDVFLRSFWKIRFLAIPRKISTFDKNNFVLDSLKKLLFGHISIHDIFRSFWKLSVLPIPPKI